MAPLTTEVLIFEANDEFRANPRLIIPAFQVALKAEGVHPCVGFANRRGAMLIKTTH